MRMVEEPEADRRAVLVAVRAKTSVGWALSIVWRVRYCFDILEVGLGLELWREMRNVG